MTNATIRVHLDLPANVSLESDAQARTLVVNRGIPSVINSGLLPVLMADGREPNLETQAGHAILGHAQAAKPPNEAQLHDIAQYERSLFSQPQLAHAFEGGPPPALPQGRTPEEIRGRKHFEQGGLCSLCHSGPLLNRTLDDRHFENIFVSQRNLLRNPVYTFLFTGADGNTNRVHSPDPGLALVTGVVRDANFFRIPTLWNIRNTAPYFHDNSAQTLDDVLAHYRLYLPLSEQDARDIVAFLNLL
jgi:cytochrome c peroxidase